MKRKLISAFFALLLLCSLAVSVSAAGEALVYDEADLLTYEEEIALNRKLAEISSAHQAQVLVITLSALESGNADTFVEYLYDSMGLGYGANHDGVLLMVCMNPREYRILSNGFAASAIEDYDIESIGDAIVSDLSDGDYMDAFETFAEESDYYLNGYVNGFPFDAGATLALSLLIGAVVGLIVVLILKGQLKTVRAQSRAHDYMKPGSMRLTHSSDLYLYRNVTRTKIQQNNSSGSGSGSSRNVGGGSF